MKKTVIIIGLVSAVALAIAILKISDDWKLALVMGIAAVVSIAGHEYMEAARNKFRQDVKSRPIPQDAETFDRLLWSMGIENQNWYLNEVCSEKDILNIISQYRRKIVETCSAEDLDCKEQIQITSKYSRQMQILAEYLQGS